MRKETISYLRGYKYWYFGCDENETASLLYLLGGEGEGRREPRLVRRGLLAVCSDLERTVEDENRSQRKMRQSEHTTLHVPNKNAVRSVESDRLVDVVAVREGRDRKFVIGEGCR